jgi:hypothetical protein
MYCVLTERSLLMMLLIVAASLVGISSSIYKPVNVETQAQSPLQSPQSPQQGQLQSPNTAVPPTLGKRLTQEDQALLDKLFPHIIRKIDGKTLAQKIDSETLINKIGGRRLAEIVLPYIQVSVGASPAYTQKTTVNKDALAPDTYHTVSVATCPPGTRVFGGGGHVLDRSLNNPKNNAEDNQIVESGVSDRGGWKITAKMSSSGEVYGYALCGKATLSLK